MRPRKASGARRPWVFAAPLLGLGLWLAVSGVVAADEGWVIESFEAEIEVRADGAIAAQETVLADFGSQQKHGIFRRIPVLYRFDSETNRVYDLSVESVTDLTGRPHRYEVSQQGSDIVIKIGDPDRTISGRQSYRIRYLAQGVLNPFPEHDELFWNVNGSWPVATRRVSATVRLPREAVQRVACYQGPLGSRQPCEGSGSGSVAAFETTRPLPEGEQLTIVVGMDKGAVPEPTPKLVRSPRTEFSEFFEATPDRLAGGALVLAAVVGLLGWAWWRQGRDQRYRSLYYLTDDPSTETRPLTASDPIVVEYEPPERLRPAQIGLLLDERADTLDATATIIDLAVRGYLTIAEAEKSGLAGLLGGKDWELSRTSKEADDLLPYERTLLDGLFSSRSPTRVSDLKNRFYKDLRIASDHLYQDAVDRKWFVGRPNRTRQRWALLGLGVCALGFAGVVWLGASFGSGLIGAPIALGGVLLTWPISRWMPRRTAQGSELLRRSLGFRQYVATAEADRQAFNERQNLFAEYLPYAIVFGCVDKWARAFQGMDTQAAVQSWYISGGGRFDSGAFSRGIVYSFTSDFSSAATSTPGGSGGSGFGGGGFSGGGGGGGGGGSW